MFLCYKHTRENKNQSSTEMKIFRKITSFQVLIDRLYGNKVAKAAPNEQLFNAERVAAECVPGDKLFQDFEANTEKALRLEYSSSKCNH